MSDKSIAVEAELDAWLGSIKTKIASRILQNLNANTDGMDRYIECTEVNEIPGAFMCCSFYQNDINDALTRAGIFMGAGKGISAGTLVDNSDFSLLNYKKLVAGHNLPGTVVRSFAKQNSNPHPAEKAFFDAFFNSPRVKSVGEKFYLIGFSIQTMKDQKGVISHEILHAHYFLDAKYRGVVQQFWREFVTADDRIAITKEVGLAYNTDDEDLVIDEFQAYLAQSNAQKDRMKTFVHKYRGELLKRFALSSCRLTNV